MTQALSARALLLSLVTSITACGVPTVPPQEDAPPAPDLHEDGVPLLVAEDEELQDLLEPEGDWLVTIRIALDGEQGQAPDRMGVRMDVPGDPQVEALLGGEGTGDGWQPLELVFRESGIHAWVFDVPEGADHARLRILSDVFPSFLAIESSSTPEGGDSVLDLAGDSSEAASALTSGQIVSRGSWGAKAPRCSSSSHNPSKITVHHTVTPTNDPVGPAVRLRQIQAYHQNVNGWCDIGYHLIVGQNGKVYRGRPLRRVGAHAAGANSNNVGIAVLGNYQASPPSAQVRAALVEAIAHVGDVEGIPLNRTRVKGHQQRGTTATSCPGQALYDRLTSIVADAASGPAPTSPFCAKRGDGLHCLGTQLRRCQQGQVSVVVDECAFNCQVIGGADDQCYPDAGDCPFGEPLPPPMSTPEQGELPEPASVHVVHRTDVWAWDAIDATSQVDGRVLISSDNRPEGVPAARWAKQLHVVYFQCGEALADRMHEIFSEADPPARIVLDELKGSTIDVVAAAAQRMRTHYPQWRGRWGAFLVNGEAVAYSNLEPAVSSLLQADAVILPEIYPKQSRYCAAGSNTLARDEWLAAFFRGSEGAFPQNRLVWLVQRRAALGSNSQLSPTFGVTDAFYGGHPAFFLDRMFYVWASRSQFRGLILEGNGGPSSWKWDQPAMGNTSRDLAFTQSRTHYSVDGKTSSRLGQVDCD